MSKKTDAKQEEISEIELSYILSELPSSQHKAGLAGLYLVIEWLKDQEINTGLFDRTAISESGLNVKLTKQDVRDLFNEIYKPIKVEIISKNEPAKGIEYKTFEKIDISNFYYYEIESRSIKKDKITKEPIKPLNELLKEERDLKTGKTKTVKYYIYEEELKEKKESDGEEIEPLREEQREGKITSFVYEKEYPLGSFLSDADKSQEGAWIKLWREMHWLLKGDRQRLGYANRSNKKIYNDDADKIWDKLISKKQNDDLSKVVFLGAQDMNAEMINFTEVAKTKFLLHFSLFVAQPYALWIEKKEKKDKYKIDEHGFTVAFPDILLFRSFIEVYKQEIKNRRENIRPYPIKRPDQAVIYLLKIAGLQFLKNLHDILKNKIGTNFTDIVYGIDLFHYDYEWKNGKTQKNRPSKFKGYSRIQPDIILEDEIMRLRQHFNNYFFQKQIIENVLSKKEPLSDFYELFRKYSYEYFFKYGNGNFKTDAIKYFNEEKIKGANMTEIIIKEEKISKTIEMLVYQIIQTYVFSKLDGKYGIIWDKEKKTLWSKRRNAPANEDDYKDKNKIAKEAFLAIRGRKDKADFITYFTSTICSVSQRLGEDGYLNLVQSLYEEKPGIELGWEKIRALSMLALSANS